MGRGAATRAPPPGATSITTDASTSSSPAPKTPEAPREALYIADELFFTGTAAEVTPIRSVDKYKIGTGRRGPITQELQDAFFDVIHRGNDPYGWLTPVPVATPAESSNGTPVESAVEGIV